jgi:hypothetical protein
LLSKENIELVLNTTIIDGVDEIYKVIWGSGVNPIEEVLGVLTDCAKRWIPKDFAAGIMIMYFKLCRGISIG